MLSKFQTTWDDHQARINIAKHCMEVLSPDTAPVRSSPYRAAPETQKFEKSKIEMMRAKNVIEPAQIELVASIVLVPNKDETLQYCVDYRKLDSSRKRDSYAITRMDERIDTLGKASVFFALDASSGYCQIDIENNEKENTAITPHHGLYQCIRMLFGLCNTSGTFQRPMNVILSSVKWPFDLVFLDNIVIFSKTTERHMEPVQNVLSL